MERELETPERDSAGCRPPLQGGDMAALDCTRAMDGCAGGAFALAAQTGTSGFGASRVRRVWARLFLPLAILFAAPAWAQTAYVSNTSNPGTSNGTVSSNHWQAQRFTTGSESGGYDLASIGLTASGAVTSLSGLTVKIYSEGTDNLPDSLVYTLTNPDSMAGGVEALFTAPANAMLSANTNYFIALEGSDPFDENFRFAADGGENTGLSAGWSIRDNRHYRNGSGGTWASSNVPLLISVYPPISTDATLSALSVADGDGNAVPLSPAFASSTTDYTASVGNDADQITIVPTENDSTATHEFLDGTDSPLTDADTAWRGTSRSISPRARTRSR